MKFKTEYGSVYIVYSDGSTQRDKAARSTPGHEGDFGPKERSVETIYVSQKAQAQGLSAAGLQGVGPKGSRVVLDHSKGLAYLLTWNVQQNKWGVAESGRAIPYYTEPEIGRYPVELWQADDSEEWTQYRNIKAYKKVHSGTRIVELTDTDTDEKLDSLKAALEELDNRLTAQGLGNLTTALAVPGKNLPALQQAMGGAGGGQGVRVGAVTGNGGSGDGDVIGTAGLIGGDNFHGAGGRTSAFDRPIPVIVMGPRPLEVAVVRGGAGGRGESEPHMPEERHGPNLLDTLLDVLSQPSAGMSQSGPNLARFIKGTKGTAFRLVGRFRDLGREFKKKRDRRGGKSGGQNAVRALASRGGGGGITALAGSGEAAGGVGALAGFGAVAGVATAGVVALGVAAVEAGKQVYAFARAQEMEVRKLAEFGPQQASAVAHLDANRVMRNMQTAQETGASSKGLIEALDKLENALRPFESIITQVANKVGELGADILTNILELLEPLLEILVKIFNNMPFHGKDIELPGKKKMEQSDFFAEGMQLIKQMEEGAAIQWPQGPIGNRR